MKKCTLLGAVLSVFALILQTQPAQAATPAGSVIRNQAQATYFDPAQDRAFFVTSTIATVRVRSAPDFELAVDNERVASPDELVIFPHTLTNTGNETDRYVLSYASVPGTEPLFDLAIYRDINENGALDPDEPAITETEYLDPGQSVALLMSGRVSPLAVPGQSYGVDISAVSSTTPDNLQTRRDIVTVASVSPLRINKSAFPACSTPLAPGGVIDYDIDLLNIEQLAPYARNYVIGGEVVRGFVIEDTIPANTVLVAGQTTTPSPQEAELVVREVSAGEDTYEPYTAYSERDLIRSVGVFIPEARLTGGQSGRFAFQVRVADTMTPGTVISNAISVDLDRDGQSDIASNQTCNTTDSQGASASLRFLEPSQPIRTNLSLGGQQSPQHSRDSDYADAPVYRLDSYPDYNLARDGVYLEVRSTALNTTAYISEEQYGNSFIRVQVQSASTGDTLYVRLLETAPNSGLFRAEVPFRLSESDAGEGRDCAPSVVEQCVLQSVSGDRIQATIFDPGMQVNLDDLAVVDPQGIVFDSTSLDPVAGAEVTIRTSNGAIAIDPDTGLALTAQLTNQTGQYTIPRLTAGFYEVFVTPPQDYTFPSIVAPSVFAGRLSVDDRSYGRDGHQDVPASGLFDASFSDAPPVIDVPLDPDLTLGQLSLTKEASKDLVSFGDTLVYTLTTTNGTQAVLLDVEIVDAPPAGFRFVENSAKLNGDPLAIARGPDARSLTFPIGRLEIGETATVTYRLQVGPEARSGRRTNVAVTTGRTGGFVPATSPRARETVEIREDGLLSDKAYLIGTVWADADMDGVRDEDEVGLPGARIWLEDGTWVETDELGRYSLYGLDPGLRIARLDDATLPEGYHPHHTTSRQIGSGLMRFVDLIESDLHRADFPLACPAEMTCGIGSAFATLAAKRAARQSPDAMLDQALAYEGLIGETVTRDLSRLREQPGPDGDISNGLLSVAGAPGVRAEEADALFSGLAQTGEQVGPSGPDDPETAAARLGRIDANDGAWLWPLPDAETDITYARDGRFMVAVRAGVTPVLYVDDVAVSSDKLGAVIENRDRGAVVAAWYGVSLSPGAHTVEVRGEDMFGNQRVLAATQVVRPGKPIQLVLEPPVEKIAADGRSSAKIVVRALDAQGAPASGNHFVTLEAFIPGVETLVHFAGQDVQPGEEGHQVRLKDGAAIVTLIAPEAPGEVRLTAQDQGSLETAARLRFGTPMRELMAVGLLELNGSIHDIGAGLEPTDTELYSEQVETDGRSAVFLKGRIKGDMLLTFAYDSEKSRKDGLFRDIDPEAYYPIYGDSSEKGFEAQSRSKLYVRIEKGDSSIMWGDFRTDAYAEDSLVRTRQALTGVNAFSRQGEWTLQGFAAETSRSKRTERIRGRGLALDVTLPGAPLVRNGEVLTIETRDRNNPGLIVEEETLTRFADYLLDDETGRLTLKAPLPSTDEFGNPVYLLATYEVEGDDADALVTGVRARRDGQRGSIWSGFTYDEAQSDADRKMYGSVGGELRFDQGRAYVEAGISDNHFDGMTSSMGEAFRAGAETNVLGGVVSGEYAQADAAFENPDAPILAGRREARAEYARHLGKVSTLKVSGFVSEDLQADTTRSSLQALAVTRLKDWTLSAGPRYTSDEGGTSESEYTSGLIRVERNLSAYGRPASSHIELERSLEDNRTRVQVGGDVLLRDDTRLYMTHRVLDELTDQTFAPGLTDDQSGLGQQRTIVGLETSILPNTDVYGEWREAGALDQGTGEAAYGVRAQWDLVEGLSIAPHLEIVDTFDSGVETEDGSAVSGDSTSLSVALADRRQKHARRTVRLEARDSDTSTFYATRAGWAQRFTPTLTSAVKFDGSRDNIYDGDDLENLRFTAGLARRPGDAGKTDWLALYQWDSELEAGERSKTHIVSTHANRQFTDRWVASGRAVTKWEDTADSTSSAQLLGGRVIRNISKTFDVEARGSVRAVQWGVAYEHSLGVAGSWRPREDVRLTLGYNFIGFHDEDLDPSGYDVQGLYWNLAIAIDEDWFGWLRPDTAPLEKSTTSPEDWTPPPAPIAEPVVATVPALIAPPPPSPQTLPAPPVSPVLVPSPAVEPCPTDPQSSRVYFAWDSVQLSEAAKRNLRDITEQFGPDRACDIERVQIVGHTDVTGPDDYNQRLSMRRAGAVADMLISLGVKPEKIELSGDGETELRSERHFDNRRAELTINIG